MWIDADVLDETLIARREVLRCTDDEPGLGYYVKLSCGHTIWITERPCGPIYCGMCLSMLHNQIRVIQAGQEAVE